MTLLKTEDIKQKSHHLILQNKATCHKASWLSMRR